MICEPCGVENCTKCLAPKQAAPVMECPCCGYPKCGHKHSKKGKR